MTGLSGTEILSLVCVFSLPYQETSPLAVLEPTLCVVEGLSRTEEGLNTNGARYLTSATTLCDSPRILAHMAPQKLPEPRIQLSPMRLKHIRKQDTNAIRALRLFSRL